MSATQEERFKVALQRLVDWHIPRVRAQSFDGPQVSSSKPGAKMLWANNFPTMRVTMDAWRAARTDEQRERVIEELEQEFRDIARRPNVERYRDHWGKTRFRIVRFAPNSNSTAS